MISIFYLEAKGWSKPFKYIIDWLILIIRHSKNGKIIHISYSAKSSLNLVKKQKYINLFCDKNEIQKYYLIVQKEHASKWNWDQNEFLYNLRQFHYRWLDPSSINRKNIVVLIVVSFLFDIFGISFCLWRWRY